jgi:hypothetical protein
MHRRTDAQVSSGTLMMDRLDDEVAGLDHAEVGRAAGTRSGSQAGPTSMRAQPSATTSSPWTPPAWLPAFLGPLLAVVWPLLASRTPLWGDESFAVTLGELGWSDMFHEFTHLDINMSAYDVLLGLWTRIAGSQDWVVRVPSMMFVGLGLWRLVALTRTLADERTARWVAAIGLLHPYVWLLALTARPYGMLFAGTVLLTELVVRAVDSGRRRDWLWWSLLAVGLLYVHLTIVMLAGAHLAYAVVLRRTRLTALAPAFGVMAVGAIPTAIWIAPANTLAWIPGITVPGAGRVVLDLAGGFVVGPITLVASALGAIAVWRRADHQRLLATTLFVVAVGVIAMIPIQSLFISMYFTVLLPTLLLGAAIAAVRWLAPAGRIGALVLGVVALLGLAVAVGTRPSLGDQNWREAMTIVGEQAQPSDGVVFPNTFYRMAAEREGQRDGRWLSAQPVLPSAPWYSLLPHELDQIKRLDRQLDTQTIATEFADFDVLWLVGPDDPQMDGVLAAAGDLGWTVSREQQAMVIRVIRLEYRCLICELR